MFQQIRKLKCLLCIVLLCGCRTKEAFYSYTVNTYAIDSIKQPYYSTDLITYGDYLLEFKKKFHINRKVQGNSESISTNYDTIGVYVLSSKSQLYYDFDTFGKTAKLIQIGNIKDKPLGYKMNSVDQGTPFNGSYSPIKRTTINDNEYFIAGIIPKNNTSIDSFRQEVILIKNQQFNSLYKVNGIFFPDRKYCIVGFRIYELNTNRSFIQEIKTLKPLKKWEKEICAHMVEIINTQPIVDDLLKR